MTAVGRDGRGAADNNISISISSPGSGPDASTKRLSTISVNVAGRSSGARPLSNTGSGQWASVYGHGQADAFHDTPDTSVAMTQPPPLLTKPSTAAAVPAGVEIYENDFDDTYDLDYEEPIAIPVAPKVAVPKSAVPKWPLPPQADSSTVGKAVGLQSDAEEVVVPWSSSPASHFAPPSGRTASVPEEEGSSLKRESSGAVPAAKRQMLPPSFTTGYASSATQETRTSTSKLKDSYDLVGPSVNAINAGKKKHKSNSANSANAKAADDGGQVTAPVHDQLARTARSAVAKNVAVTLSAEQKHVLDLVTNHGQSVFFTGPAGTGKSVLMRAIIDELRQKYQTEPERVAVTASTGFAACNIGGITLHSFAGMLFADWASGETCITSLTIVRACRYWARKGGCCQPGQKGPTQPPCKTALAQDQMSHHR
jgi:ATP-dependent DNA helicase PIF1